MANNDKSKVVIVNKRLIVEGEQDKRVIPELMEANGVNWQKGKEPVYIEAYGSDEFIDNKKISTRLKASWLTHLGLIIDADQNPEDRWQSIRNACLKVEAIQKNIDDLPEEMPESGIILNMINNQKFGIWMMPDNQNRGMLETFLAYMIKDESEPLWLYAQEVVIEAKIKGAEFIDEHIDKAYIYSWLAWQKPPGRQLHNAIQEKILDPKHPKAQVFVKWFKDLYDL
ncbi:hypothetical protein A0J48_002465 [Sphaerospermopsis aphanizomenoides BCCUSP55]|uniref:DUF3226 domain-containing protein n=1 Tax=Sphaerospermopsis aphanizomenoides TaxID=459663 RepID=UPI0019085DBE|nr:DUF3226 domain-containing protein [Sphaerospermopsis aphanizomenoides]MBK1986424.1 hypothetical protein [Sphaerospermopsis aphanizomenoides BCCUSP55]